MFGLPILLNSTLCDIRQEGSGAPIIRLFDDNSFENVVRNNAKKTRNF